MPTRAQLRQAQSQAAMEATRLHFNLDTSYDNPIDVLKIARSLGLRLMMQPLDNLLGFYVRQAKAAGIVINSRVPESLQRFTLAHEIGHHVLGHGGSADDSHALDRFDPDSILEVQAQAFAASLLMPLPLVMRALRDLPSARQGLGIRDTDAYLFSRQLGVSYAAGVWALYRRGLLTLADARGLIKRGALAAKTSIVGNSPASNARADIWVLDEENNDLTVLCRVGDEIHVQLKEDTSTGRVWAIRSPDVRDFYKREPFDELVWDGGEGLLKSPLPSVSGDLVSDALELIQDTHRNLYGKPNIGTNPDKLDSSVNAPFPDAGGIRELTLVPRHEGRSHVRLELARPWDAPDEAANSFEVDLMVRPLQLAGAGLLAPEGDVWVTAHAVAG